MDSLEELFPRAASEDLFQTELLGLLGLSNGDDFETCGDVSPLKQEPLATDAGLLLPNAQALGNTLSGPAPTPTGRERSRSEQVGARSVSEAGTGAMSSQQASDEEEQSVHAVGGQPKRRRRVRNQKQQELNRLAQMRYRERKKQKQQNLQQEAQAATTIVDLKDKQIADLKTSVAELQQTVLTQQAVLQQASSTLASQSRTIAEQERALAEHRAAADKQRVDPALLTETLANVLKDALTELGSAVPGAAAAQLQDKLTAALSRTLGTCWRDVRVLATAVPKSPAEASGRAQAPPITVSCC